MSLIFIIVELETKKGEFENDEYFIKKHYKSVSESLQLFTNDDLLHAPGMKYMFTFTLTRCLVNSSLNSLLAVKDCSYIVGSKLFCKPTLVELV